mgnify:CR=1 FL=1
MVNYGLVTPLNDYLSLCGPEIQEEIPPEDWQCVTVNGMICGVPINREKATGRGFIYRKDLAEALGVYEEDLQTMQDLEDLLIKVRDAYPGMYPVVTSSGWPACPWLTTAWATTWAYWRTVSLIPPRWSICLRRILTGKWLNCSGIGRRKA